MILKEIGAQYVIIKTRKAHQCAILAKKFAELKQVLATEYAPNVIHFGKYATRPERIDFKVRLPKHLDSPTKGNKVIEGGNYHDYSALPHHEEDEL